MWNMGRNWLWAALLVCLLGVGLTGVALAEETPDHLEPKQVTGVCESTTATVSWAAVNDAHLTGYDVYRKTSSQSTYVRVNSVPITVTEFVVTGLTSGTTYNFGVVAVYNDGHGSAMSVTTCTTG